MPKLTSSNPSVIYEDNYSILSSKNCSHTAACFRNFGEKTITFRCIEKTCWTNHGDRWTNVERIGILIYNSTFLIQHRWINCQFQLVKVTYNFSSFSPDHYYIKDGEWLHTSITDGVLLAFNISCCKRHNSLEFLKRRWLGPGMLLCHESISFSSRSMKGTNLNVK